MQPKEVLSGEKLKNVEDVLGFLWGADYDELEELSVLLVEDGHDIKWFEDHGFKVEGMADRIGDIVKR